MGVNVSNNNIDSSPRESLTNNKSNKIMYIDLGVRCIATVWYEGLRRPVAFSGNELLYDWFALE